MKPDKCVVFQTELRLISAWFAAVGICLLASCSYDPELDSLGTFPSNSEEKSIEEVALIAPAVEKERIVDASEIKNLEPEKDPADQPTTIEPGVIAYPLLANKLARQRFEMISDQDSYLKNSSTVEFNNENAWMLNSPFASTGLACGDFDGDRLPDVLVTDKQRGVVLYKNLGDLQFQDITEDAGIEIESMWGTSATVVDINNDGLLDFYLCGFDQPNRLYVNRGRKFVERASSYGLDFQGASVSAAFADFDRDGDMDVYLVTHRLPQSASIKKVPVIEEPGKPPRIKDEFLEIRRLIPYFDGGFIPVESGQYDYLLRNDNSLFVDVTDESFERKQPLRGMAATWCDFNNDGWPDLYVTNDGKDSDQLLMSQGPDQNGKIEFKDVTAETVKQVTWFAKGVDFGDLNQDGRFDLVVGGDSKSDRIERASSRGNLLGNNSDAWFLSFSKPARVFGNAVLLNGVGNQFANVGRLLNVADTDCTWSMRTLDFDNDGKLDLFCSNGAVRDFLSNDLNLELQQAIDSQAIDSKSHFWIEKPGVPQSNFLFRNQGDLGFEDSTQMLNPDSVNISQSSIVHDMDHDGDQDIVTVGLDDRIVIWRNDVTANNSILVKLKGRQSNRAGIGAVCRLESQGSPSKQVWSNATTRGFVTSSEGLMHFGLNDSEFADQLEIRWPSGTVQTLTGIPANRYIEIEEPKEQSIVGRGLRMELDKKMFASVANELGNAEVVELEFDDFATQRQLPARHSLMGPGLAWGDVDGDGDYDLFLGGSSFEPGRIFENLGDLRFQVMDQPALKSDSSREDLGALFFDVDNDGDEDLYVTSGGVEGSREDSFEDRLYLNPGNGRFERAENAVPKKKFSSMALAAVDFDRDRNTDLFVGGRVVPGQFSQIPRSALLRNVGGKFEDVTETVAPELGNCGLVTSCVWTDVDGDGFSDLLICTDWGRIRLFRNNGRRIQEVDDDVLSTMKGMFRSIAVGDIDNDGDSDYVVGNLGLNTEYQASTDEPMRLRLLQIGDGQGTRRILETFVSSGKEYPFRSLHSFGQGISLELEVESEFEFASTSIGDTFENLELDDDNVFELNELRSGVLVNRSVNGEIRFDFRPLPKLAQASPMTGCQLVDVNGDGNLDLYALQNQSDFHPLSEQATNGFSCLLLGQGDGNFRPVGENTGLTVAGDGRALSVVDLNSDARPDFVASSTNSLVHTFINQSSYPPFAINLKTLSGRKSCIGARVELEFANGKRRLHEIQCGGGYISQSPPIIYSGPIGSSGIESMTIYWPDGTSKTGNVKNLINK